MSSAEAAPAGSQLRQHLPMPAAGAAPCIVPLATNWAPLAGVTKYLNPSVAGFLLQKELDFLGGAVDKPKRPFAAIVGGSKVQP